MIKTCLGSHPPCSPFLLSVLGKVLGLRSDPDSLIPDLVLLAIVCVRTCVYRELQDKIAFKELNT